MSCYWLSILTLLATVTAYGQSPYSRSDLIAGVSFDNSTAKTLAPGSDIWAITWAEDGHLYTSFGDGGGFGGTNKDGRVSFGVARIEGPRSAYRGVNLAGGKDAPNPAPFTGKSEGILAIGNVLYLWRDGELSDQNAFKWLELYRSDDKGASWRFTGVRFDKPEFFGAAFCQFGRGYSGARDGYVYIYAPDIIDRTHWGMRVPGRINLARVAIGRIEDTAAYQFYSGRDQTGNPQWVSHAADRKPVWEDAKNGTHRIAVSYNPVLKRYLLTTVTVSRDGWMSIYEGREPWGPWRLVHTEQNPDRWGGKVILFTFVNKWLDADGLGFVIVHTKNDA